MTGGLIAFGADPAEVPYYTLDQSQMYFYGASDHLNGQATQLRVGAGLMGDQEGVDVVQTGSGITPILGANLSFAEDRFNIGIKYEFKTKMDLTNDTKKDFVTGINPDGSPETLFPDGEVTNADIPAMLSVGIGWQIIEPVTLQFGYHTYFDKAAGWAEDENGLELVDKNFSEYAVGVEWALGPKFRLSGGYLLAVTGANEHYQSDLSFSLTTNTFGYGFAWDLGKAVTLQFGGFVTSYSDETFNKEYGGIKYTETYDKFTYALSLGLDIKLGGNKE
jgi:long-chain fatty acid transport protein